MYECVSILLEQTKKNKCDLNRHNKKLLRSWNEAQLATINFSQGLIESRCFIEQCRVLEGS